MHRDPAKEASIAFLVHEVARLYRRRFEEEARTYGVTLPQWRAMAVIQKHAGISQVALAGKIDTDPMTISGILDRLDKRGLIERFLDPNDSRSKLARLTAEGELLVKTARSVSDGLQEVSLERLSDDDRRVLSAHLIRIRDNLNNLTTAEQKEAV